eukprot:1151141-Pelagomonas_calceolata.AAC.4
MNSLNAGGVRGRKRDQALTSPPTSPPWPPLLGKKGQGSVSNRGMSGGCQGFPFLHRAQNSMNWRFKVCSSNSLKKADIGLAGSSQGLPVKVSRRFPCTSHCLPRPPDTAGLPKLCVREVSPSFRVGGALGGPGRQGKEHVQQYRGVAHLSHICAEIPEVTSGPGLHDVA